MGCKAPWLGSSTIGVSVAVPVLGSHAPSQDKHLQELFLPWLIPDNIPQGHGTPALCQP